MPEPEWLTPAERELWLRLVNLTLLLPGAVEAQLRRDAKLGFFDYHVLASLSDAEDRSRLMSDLAFHAGASLSRISHVVTRLEKQGWVRRCASASDGRSIFAVLTDSGLEHLARHAPGHVAEVRRLIFDSLPPERVAALSEGLAGILDAVDPARRTALNAGAVEHAHAEAGEEASEERGTRVRRQA